MGMRGANVQETGSFDDTWDHHTESHRTESNVGLRLVIVLYP